MAERVNPGLKRYRRLINIIAPCVTHAHARTPQREFMRADSHCEEGGGWKGPNTLDYEALLYTNTPVVLVLVVQEAEGRRAYLSPFSHQHSLVLFVLTRERGGPPEILAYVNPLFP